MKFDSSSNKKIILSVVALLFIFFALFHTLDHRGEDYTNQAMKRALITFGVARGLNAVISVAQGTEVAIHPAGFGVNFTPGQILDPINDLIEQFSWVMLVSSASLGIQKILLEMSSSIALTILLAIILGVYVLSLWEPTLFSAGLRRGLTTLGLLIMFLRFSVPMLAVTSELFYQYFLQDQYVQSNERLENTQQNISELSQKDTKEMAHEDNESLMNMAKHFFESASESLSINSRIEKYQKIAADATEQAINLIVIFVIQTILLPLLFLWGFYRGLRALWAGLITV